MRCIARGVRRRRRPDRAPAADRQRILRAVAPGHHRLDGVPSSVTSVSKPRRGRSAAAPAFHCGVPVLRRISPAGEIGEGGLVRRHHAGAAARLDRHVAERQPAFHGQAADGAAGIFDHMPGRPRGADFRNDGQDHVLGRHALRPAAIDGDPHGLRLALPQRLGRQHMRDLGAADAEGQRPERPMGGGVAVAADQQQPGLGQPGLAAPSHGRCPGSGRPGRTCGCRLGGVAASFSTISRWRGSWISSILRLSVAT